MQRNYSIQSVSRAVKLIETIAGADTEIGAQAISEQVGLNLSTVFRFLQTLAQEGIIEQNSETGKYRLGLKLLAWGTQVGRQMDLRQVALPLLRELNERTQETIHMSVFDRDAAIYIEKLESPTPLRAFSGVGKGAPLHCTGVGKILMAALTDKELSDLFKRYPLKRYTPNTITQIGPMRKELQRIRDQGFAMDNEEHEPGIRCVAAPVLNHTREVIASISVAGRTTTVTSNRMPELIKLTRDTADKISVRLGYRKTKKIPAHGRDRIKTAR